MGGSVTLGSALREVERVSCVAEPGAWRVSWSPLDGAEAYEVQQTTSIGQFPWLLVATVSGNELRMPSALAEEVWIRVRAVSVTGAGPWSDPVLIRTRQASARMVA